MIGGMSDPLWRLLFCALLLPLLSTVALAQPATGTAPAREAQAKPRVLVVSVTKAYRHDSIGVGNETVRAIGVESGAFEAVAGDDLSLLDPDKINQFGAVVFLSTTGELPLTDRQKQSLLDFVRGGGGFVGIHSATDTFYGWPEYGEMIGAYFDGHPWNAGDTVTIKVDEPAHPVAAPWAKPTLTFKEEIYQFRRPYDRRELRVLLSLDVAKTDLKKGGIKRRDGDFALAWVKPFGKGRVFYTALGHNESVWKMPAYREHLLAGIRLALGQLDAPIDPPGGADRPMNDPPAAPATVPTTDAAR
jgi:type 1 glutamine amidotransferase